ncbi:MAG: CocE/NonD family hydrolase [Crocinitomicaceae bacterium]
MKTLITLATFLSSYVCLSQLTETLNNIWIPMRDGDSLQADIYIPSNVDSAEVILIQTPYNKDAFNNLPLGINQNLDAQPFIWVIVDWRGFYGSNGADVSNVNRGEDGYDICEWISQQTWHKSRIGTWGPSALGRVQYSTAREHHPNHTCAVPLVAHPQQSYDDYFMNGVLEGARLETLDLLGYGLSPLIMGNTYYSPIWTISENNTWYPQDIWIPTLQIGGWYDHNIDKMMDWYAATRSSSLIAVQDQQWLVVGPWVHGGTGAAYVGSANQGELSYPNAEFVGDSMAWDFFSHYLLDSANNWQNTPMITYYETGLDQWATSNASSIESVTDDILYLNMNGGLVSSNPLISTSFISDPNDPSPTIGGANLHLTLDQGPYDQSSLDTRSDILTFETSALLEDVSISGRVRLNLYVEATVPDCDISIRLVDQYPDGRSMLITDGIQRMRFRNGFTQADESFMTPGAVYNAQFELPFTNYNWKSGHKIKIYLGGNNAIRYHVNNQHSGDAYVGGSPTVGGITIHHNSTYPSNISLPGNNPILASQEIIPKGTIEIYPNPSSQSIHFDGLITDLKKIEVRNLTGTVLFSTEKMIKKMDVSNFTNGVYLITFLLNGELTTKRFVKN